MVGRVYKVLLVFIAGLYVRFGVGSFCSILLLNFFVRLLLLIPE